MLTTSAIARDTHERTGKAENHRRTLVELIQQHPGSTAGELAALSLDEFDHVEACRRLDEISGELIHRQGRRKCKVRGTSMTLWYPGPKPTTQAKLF